MPAPLDLVALLGEDIAAVLDGLGAVVTDVRLVTGLPARRADRATFRVTLTDGRVVKARRVARPERARRLARHLGALADAPLPALLAVHGRVTIEEWVTGTPLSELPLSPERVAGAADLLGGLHARTTLGGRRLRATRPTRPLLRRVERRLAWLASADGLRRAETVALLDLLHRAVPEEAVRGLTHNDFCAENLVEDAAGRLVAVDNEGLRPGFLDFDLARTWYRWPMPEPSWQAFMARYARWCALSPATEAPLWRIAAVAKSAQIRMRRGAAAAATPIDRLRAIIAEGV